MVGTGEVDLAGCLREDGADARFDDRVSDFARGWTRGVGFLFGTADKPRRFDARVGTERIPERLPVKPGGRVVEKRVISCSPSWRSMRR